MAHSKNTLFGFTATAEQREQKGETRAPQKQTLWFSGKRGVDGCILQSMTHFPSPLFFSLGTRLHPLPEVFLQANGAAGNRDRSSGEDITPFPGAFSSLRCSPRSRTPSLYTTLFISVVLL